MSMDEFIKLLPSRQRRSLLKGLTNEQRILMEHVRQSRKENASKPVPVKSHVRDMIVIPEMLGLTLQLHSGKEYVAIDIKPEMIGHFVGEFAITSENSRLRTRRLFMEHRGSALRGQACTFLSSRLDPGSLIVSNQEISPFSEAVFRSSLRTGRLRTYLVFSAE